MAQRLSSRSAWSPCVHTKRSCGGCPGRHSFHAPPGNGVKPPSAVASPTDGVGTSVQRGKLAKSLPLGDTAALVIMTLPDETTEISSISSFPKDTPPRVVPRRLVTVKTSEPYRLDGARRFGDHTPRLKLEAPPSSATLHREDMPCGDT